MRGKQVKEWEPSSGIVPSERSITRWGAGGIRFVTVSLNSSQVKMFKKEFKRLLKDSIRLAEQLDQFLGPNIYTWEEM